MENNGNGLTQSQRDLNKKINFHSWVATIMTMLVVIFAVALVYSKSIVAIDINAREHREFTKQDSINISLRTKMLRTLDVMYVNQLRMAKKLNIELTKEEELYLNQSMK